MKNIKHTAAPWSRVINLNKAGDYCIHHKGKTICIMPSQEEGENEANAQLIAAAPETAAERNRLKELNKELTEALERILIIYKKEIFQGAAFDNAKSAIAKSKSL